MKKMRCYSVPDAGAASLVGQPLAKNSVGGFTHAAMMTDDAEHAVNLAIASCVAESADDLCASIPADSTGEFSRRDAIRDLLASFANIN